MSSRRSETARVYMSNIPFSLKICDKTTHISRVIQWPTSPSATHLPLWSPSQVSAMMTSYSLKRPFRIRTCCCIFYPCGRGFYHWVRGFVQGELESGERLLHRARPGPCPDPQSRASHL